jgi:hypothetical protein
MGVQRMLAGSCQGVRDGRLVGAQRVPHGCNCRVMHTEWPLAIDQAALVLQLCCPIGSSTILARRHSC